MKNRMRGSTRQAGYIVCVNVPIARLRNIGLTYQDIKHLSRSAWVADAMVSEARPEKISWACLTFHCTGCRLFTHFFNIDGVSISCSCDGTVFHYVTMAFGSV